MHRTIPRLLVAIGVTLVALLTMGERPGARVRPLDKSGTTGRKAEDGKSQLATTSIVARHVWNGAERAGFEPAVGFNPHAALAKRCYRPLSHLSDPPDADAGGG